MPEKKTAIITGASRGIGAGLVRAFLKQGYNVVATSRNVSQHLTDSSALVLIDGDIGKPETAAKVVEAAIKNFGSIDLLVSNAGVFFAKPFTKFSTADFNALVEDLVKTLNKFNVPAKEQSELLGVLGPMKPQIVNQ